MCYAYETCVAREVSDRGILFDAGRTIGQGYPEKNIRRSGIREQVLQSGLNHSTVALQGALRRAVSKRPTTVYLCGHRAYRTASEARRANGLRPPAVYQLYVRSQRKGLLDRVAPIACARGSTLGKPRAARRRIRRKRGSSMLTCLMRPAMTFLESRRRQLFERAAQALCGSVTLESAHKATMVVQFASLRRRTDRATIAIGNFDCKERATHSETDRVFKRYANALRACGVRKVDRVAVMLPICIELPVRFLAFANLDSVSIKMRYPSREIEYVLAGTKAKFVIVDESGWPVFKTVESWLKKLAGKRVIVVRPAERTRAGLGALLRFADEPPLEQVVAADDLLTIQHASGTSGLPNNVDARPDGSAPWRIRLHGAPALQQLPGSADIFGVRSRHS